uniref:Uncharacterized protein n=1 Tax=Eptatretus burgeri TaxID=7764 RepID=A0A8C4NAC3_EPTBU
MSHRSANTRPSKRQPQRWHDWQAREQENFGNQSTTGELSQLWRRRDGARTKGEFRLLGKGFTEINGGTGETTAERRTSRHEVKANNGGYEGYSISHYSNRASVPKDTRKSHERGTYTEEVRLNHLLRRAAREDDRECRLATIKLLCDFVQQADNSQVNGKNVEFFSVLASAITEKRSVHLCVAN